LDRNPTMWVELEALACWQAPQSRFVLIQFREPSLGDWPERYILRHTVASWIMRAKNSNDAWAMLCISHRSKAHPKKDELAGVMIDSFTCTAS